MDRAFVIGIAGGTGSGKTTLTKEIKERFGQCTSVVYHDNYYKAHDELSYDERCRLNYDSPDAFDNDLMARQLALLIEGHAIDCPLYDYANHNRCAQTIRIEPNPIIIVEGILLFAHEQLRAMCDVRIFVDTDADVRILRRVKRDVIERGRTIESVEQQYLATVKPMHELYVEPSKRTAHIIIPEGGHNLVALDMLFHRISHELRKRDV